MSVGNLQAAPGSEDGAAKQYGTGRRSHFLLDVYPAKKDV